MDAVSICMPYHERRDQLERSLRHYEQVYDGLLELEISIVDDRSVPSLVMPETNLDVMFSRIEGKPGALNPCVPMNQAVNQSRYDIIVLTNPEIVHHLPALIHMLDELEDKTYVTARCVDERGGLVSRRRCQSILDSW